MKAHRAIFPLAAMCRVLGLSTSGYSDWLRRGPSARERRDAELRRAIRRIWRESEKIEAARGSMRRCGTRASG